MHRGTSSTLLRGNMRYRVRASRVMYLALLFTRDLPRETCHENFDIAVAFVERRQVDGQHVQTVTKILRQLAGR